MKHRLLIRLALLLTCLVSASCDTLTGTSNIEYRVTGVNVQRVSLTYESEGGGTAQVSSATVPWSYAFKAKRNDFLYISAQIVQGTGSVTVGIYKSGDLYKDKSTTSSGFASIASASGSLE